MVSRRDGNRNLWLNLWHSRLVAHGIQGYVYLATEICRKLYASIPLHTRASIVTVGTHTWTAHTDNQRRDREMKSGKNDFFITRDHTFTSVHVRMYMCIHILYGETVRAKKHTL